MNLGGICMPYIVAKHRDKRGSIAIEMEPGNRLNGLDEYLSETVLGTGTQIVLLSHPDAYQEYAPCEILLSEEEFIRRTLHMGTSGNMDRKSA